MPREFSPAATKKPRDLGRLAEHRRQVGGEALRPAEERADAGRRGAGKRRIAASRYGAIRSQSGGSVANAKSAGVPSSRPGRGDRLEHADQQAAALLAVVAVAGRVLDHRQVAVTPSIGSVSR